MMIRPPFASTCRTWRPAIGGFILALLFAIPLSQAQTFSVLYTFHGQGNGRYPEGRLVQGSEGGAYATTYSGGSFGYGTVFAIDSRGKESVLSSFWGGNGLGPESGLTQDSAGNFYGTTYDGGTLEGGLCLHGCGTVFKLGLSGKLTVLYAFTGGADGGQPEAGLVQDAVGNLYGTTTIGGDLSCRYGLGCGVVFKLDTTGKETVLHAFSGSPSDGWYPTGELVPDGNGGFYGTTWFGGPSGYGTIYKLESSGQETVLFNFTGISGGEYPNGPLVQDAQANVYGTTNGGGDTSCDLCGLVFKLDAAGHETVLHTFTGSSDGAYPYAGLILDPLGNLYGTTYGGGSTGCGVGCGTVFKVDAKGNETVLHAFTGGADGAWPRDRLIMDASGNLYGTAPGGGDLSCGGCGVVFKLVP